ncbi:carbohydrate ABC transporter permease [Microlunatus soli]|uniref:Carbohydrate ABC transporter membrane protein 2, CUT1 family n=1 Tax=Microlunatus soli TaxID=630515 RepID=A0A1H1ZD82_9ACTN|nr:carbohydrate ABC transporter permease [Microlunatus soli]SDT31613.1 carbohydrate ABC transporter membrane protein 2, CUT1 family [Microlunatus soli]
MTSTSRGRLVSYGVVTLITLVMVYPLLWLLGSSFKPDQDIFTSASALPLHPTADNYRTGWSAGDVSFGQYMINSLMVCLLCALGNVVSCSLAAFAFARIRFAGRRVWFGLMMGSIMLPGHVLLVPQYFMFNTLGWIGSYLPLIIPKFLATDAFFVFLMVQFIRGLPAELDEAAELDGCGRYATFARIVLPLTGPAIVTTAVFSFIWTYEDFLTPLIYLNDSFTYTVPIGLNMFIQGLGQSSYGQMLAMSVVSLAPVIIFFLLFQRQLLNGIATTGMKG